ncbi:MAG: hypothetical protein JW715_13285 [Sedimentisphaerales bacterium]|nr:hypothetical protein [Sedimentisphaerales bacterium]
MRLISILITAILVNIVAVFSARGQVNRSDESTLISSSAAKKEKPKVIIVAGAAGTTEYQADFARCADFWRQACSKANVEYVVIGQDEVEGPNDCDILRQTLGNEPKETDTALWLVFIGHGTFDSRTAKFNLRGPDLSAQDLAEWLKPFSRPLAVINTTSSSAPFLNKLSGENRVIITATKSGYELNYTRFGQYFADAITDPHADIDKDGQTSLLEAFLAASHQVAEFYSAAGRLATEHSLLDDNGDGLGTPADWFLGIRPVQRARDNAELDGYRAHQFNLIFSETESKMTPQMRSERDRIELEVMNLRDKKEKLTEEEYFAELEKLLYKMAQIYEQIDNTSENTNQMP